MSHILITGGTGMLSGAVINFLSEYETVSVIARNISGFKKFTVQTYLTDRTFTTDLPEKLNTIILDYSDTELLSQKIISAIHSKGPVTSAVSWIHSHSENSNRVIGNILNSQKTISDYFHILGSAYYDPSKNNNDIEDKFSEFSNVFYKKIILGFKTDNGVSRWLTDKEISDGVSEAVKIKAYEFKIGLTEPWENHP